MARKSLYRPSSYIGRTIDGTVTPFFFDPHTPPSRDMSGGCLVTGSPGAGKTHLLLLLTVLSTLLGKPTIAIDPKGDFKNLKALEADLGTVSVWDITSENTPSGLLDPFYMESDPFKQIALASDLIQVLAEPDSHEKNALAPILNDVLREENPNLYTVVSMLRGSENEHAQMLGGRLKMIQDMPVSRLFFNAGDKNKQINVAGRSGLTIVDISGLQIPKNGKPPKTDSERMGAGVFFLVTNYIYQLMNNTSNQTPKTVVIDEVHIPASTPAGAQVIEDLAFLGRSKFMALIIATQTTGQLKNLNLDTTLSTQFAFRTSKKDAAIILKDMDLPLDIGLDDRMVSLDNGECLVKDWEKKFAIVKIDVHRKDWSKVFETNPAKKKEEEAEEAIRREQEENRISTVTKIS